MELMQCLVDKSLMDAFLEKNKPWLWSILATLGFLSSCLLGVIAFQASRFTDQFDALSKSVQEVNVQLTAIAYANQALKETKDDHEFRLRVLENAERKK